MTNALDPRPPGDDPQGSATQGPEFPQFGTHSHGQV